LQAFDPLLDVYSGIGYSPRRFIAQWEAV